ncbi:PREDICTED: tRNA selenocysteine 1-associated protein 1 [Bactrocera latifrons]|nr:PREDICTED: tRNA selenocysteine 1-associated protein 1 [Bactrocera latifrons]XP_039952339.1 tRNA selenocysteine 1-associated protein 1 [Bactrocera tryoni]XP_050318344.1 tRNA selenocysteine 1-associated protein 1 [Bactrocera neohumeralis]
MSSSVHCQLWMGSLEPYMTENFIIAAFRKMGEEPTTVRLMRNKYTGEPAGYCFVNFATDESAMDAMHKLNGKPIPGTNPIVRFRLNSASNSYKLPGNEREFSVWVGDLSSDVDDYQLYKVFSTKYTSIKTAKVILDSSGFSKGYGFVRFGIEDEQKSALYDMNGYIGLGTKPIKICNAVPKPKNELGVALGTTSNYGYGGVGITGTSTTTATTADYSQYYDPTSTYWQNYNSWQGYYDQSGAGAISDPNSAYYQQSIAQSHANPQTLAQHAEAWSAQRAAQYEQQAAATAAANNTTNVGEDDDYALVEHKYTLDIDKLNRETLDADRLLYDALESSKWLPLEQLETY